MVASRQGGQRDALLLRLVLHHVGLFLGSPDTPGWKTYGLHLIVDMILAIHLGGQAGKVDRGLWSRRST